MTNGAKQEGPKCWFYELWDQNVNWKLIRGSLMQLSHYLCMVFFNLKMEVINKITWLWLFWREEEVLTREEEMEEGRRKPWVFWAFHICLGSLRAKKSFDLCFADVSWVIPSHHMPHKRHIANHPPPHQKNLIRTKFQMISNCRQNEIISNFRNANSKNL